MGHKMRFCCLAFLLWCNNVFAVGDKVYYFYQYDSDGYVNHQITNEASMKDYGIEYTHNETTAQTAFYYDTLLATKKGKLFDVNYKLGVGSLFGLDWSPTPIFYIDLYKSGLNLNVKRDARASGSSSA